MQKADVWETLCDPDKSVSPNRTVVVLTPLGTAFNMGQPPRRGKGWHSVHTER